MANQSYNKSEAKRFLKRTISGLGKMYYGGHISGKKMVELSMQMERIQKSLK